MFINEKEKKSREVDTKKELSDNLEDTDSLKYDAPYKANILRKSSTISTNVSQSEINSDNFSFNRERFNSMPISNYFDGIDNYFRGLYPQQNNYQKSKNYLEKKYFFKYKEHFPSVDIDYIYNNKNNINNKTGSQEKKEKIHSEINSNKINYNNTNPQISQNIPTMCCFGFCSIDCKNININYFINIFYIYSSKTRPNNSIYSKKLQKKFEPIRTIRI